VFIVIMFVHHIGER